MLTSDEKSQLRKELEQNEKLSPASESKVKQAVKNGEKNLLGDDDICCEWRDTVGPINYTKTDTKTCENVLLGNVVDDSNCT